MVTFEEAVNIAKKETIPDGKVYYAGDAGTFYIFTIVPKDFPVDIKGAMFGTTFTAVDKSDGHTFIYSVLDPLPDGIKKVKTLI